MIHKGIDLNGIRYREGSKCPSCSSEVDTGGRLELKKIKNYFLKCKKCKYVIRSKKVRDKQENRDAQMRNNILRG
jgi:uncharacterized Zn finger protein